MEAHEGQRPQEHDFLLTDTDLLAVNLTTPREKAVEKADELNGATMPVAAKRMGAENFMFSVCL